MPHTAVLSLEILAGNSPKDRETAVKFANALTPRLNRFCTDSSKPL